MPPSLLVGFLGSLRRVLRLVDMFTNERNHISGTRDASKSRLKALTMKVTCTPLLGDLRHRQSSVL